jgi:hypothetical protein
MVPDAHVVPWCPLVHLQVAGRQCVHRDIPSCRVERHGQPHILVSPHAVRPGPVQRSGSSVQCPVFRVQHTYTYSLHSNQHMHNSHNAVHAQGMAGVTCRMQYCTDVMAYSEHTSTHHAAINTCHKAVHAQCVPGVTWRMHSRDCFGTHQT